MAAIVITDQNDASFPDVPSVDTFVNPLQAIISQLQEANSHLEKIDDSVAFLVDMLESNQLDMIEKDREKKDSSKKIGTPKGEVQEEEDSSLEEMLWGLGLGLLVAGIAAGLANIEENLKALDEALAEPQKILERLRLKTTDAIESLVNFWESSIVENFQALALKPFSTRISAGLTAAGTTLQKFGDDILATGSKYFENLGKKFSNLGKFTKVLGVIFRPVVILFEGISRAFEEFGKLGEDASIGDYLQAAAKVVIKTFLSFWTGLGDLIKDGFSWLLEKVLGEDNAISNFLDSFSITGIMEKLVDMFFEGWNLIAEFDWRKKIFDPGIQAIKDAMSSAMDHIANWLSGIAEEVEMIAKNFVAAIIPNKDAFVFEIPSLTVAGREVVSATKVDLNPIPDAIYQWAGEGSKPRITPPSSSTQNTASLAENRRVALEQSSMQNIGANQMSPNITVLNDNSVRSNSSTVQQMNPNFSGIPPSWSQHRGNAVSYNNNR